MIDYIILVAIVAFSTLVSRMMGGGGRSAGNSSETVGIALATVVLILAAGGVGLNGQNKKAFSIANVDGTHVGLTLDS